MEDEDRNTQMFKHLKNYKGDPKCKKRDCRQLIAEIEPKIFAPIGSGLDNRLVVIKVSTRCRIINPNETA